MALNTWRAVLTDLSYVPVGELQNASDRVLTKTLNRTDTASFKIRTDNPFADLVQSLDCYLKLYRNDVLVFFGLLQSSEESVSVEGGSITATAAGPGWVFPKRYPVRHLWPAVSKTGTRSQIAVDLLQGLNEQERSAPETGSVAWERSVGETGVNVDGTFSAGGTITLTIPPFKPFSELLDELSNSADGFDWRVLPYENWVGGELVTPAAFGRKHGTFIVGEPLGTTRPEAVFEFGDGRQNISKYTRIKSRDTQANDVYHLLSGQMEDFPARATFGDPTDRELYMGAGLVADIVQADLTDYTQRTNLVVAHFNVRNQPRHLVQWTPVSDYGDGRLPRYGIDYDLGDFVTGRARSNGSVRFNGQFRVWGVEFTVDNAGVETPQVMLEYTGA